MPRDVVQQPYENIRKVLGAEYRTLTPEVSNRHLCRL